MRNKLYKFGLNKNIRLKNPCFKVKCNFRLRAKWNIIGINFAMCYIDAQLQFQNKKSL